MPVGFLEGLPAIPAPDYIGTSGWQAGLGQSHKLKMPNVKEINHINV